jgi:hypothetical protein
VARQDYMKLQTEFNRLQHRKDVRKILSPLFFFILILQQMEKEHISDAEINDQTITSLKKKLSDKEDEINV